MNASGQITEKRQVTSSEIPYIYTLYKTGNSKQLTLQSRSAQQSKPTTIQHQQPSFQELLCHNRSWRLVHLARRKRDTLKKRLASKIIIWILIQTLANGRLWLTSADIHLIPRLLTKGRYSFIARPNSLSIIQANLHYLPSAYIVYKHCQLGFQPKQRTKSD